ncbi:flagellin N-terminal helical domain-containing protein [Exiguobacterium flavidum]|uniref:flagellin N-terminal helical domain-containing protein n=1 Tax=Exiguobacterium flavidum TaxID=2184695 RepID=UPI000DF7F522|nr:flagellin [Exiguobacterium flavidum]
MIINHNITALNTHNKLSSASAAQGKSMEKLASGLRINKAGDDAAGLAISEKMRAQVRGLDQASRNAQDGISLIQTAEGALNETHDILQRMRELAVQSSNDTSTNDDRKEMQKEINQLVDEIDRISSDTEFNTQALLDGSFSGKKFQIGSNEGQEMTLSISAMGSANMGTAGVTSASVTTTGLDFSTTNSTLTIGDTSIVIDEDYTGDAAGLAARLNQAFSDTEGVKVTANGADIVFEGSAAFTVTAGADNNGFLAAGTASAGATTGAAINTLKDAGLAGATGLQTQLTAKAAITSIDNAIKTVSSERSMLGASQNRLDHTINNLKTSSENLTAAESRIRDVDMAKEMMNQTKNSILAQAAQAMLAQSNQTPQGVLQLLR